MNQDIQVPRTGLRRNRWLTGGSLFAAAVVSLTILPNSAYAQRAMRLPAGDTNTNGGAVNASANYSGMEVSYIPESALDTVVVLVDSAIINWTTNVAGTAGGEVTFLDAGNQLEFTGALSEYTVLNRIFTPTVDAAVRIDGNITSRADFGSSEGGNIWFYSPGGLIIGASSVFDVGSLVLTSSDLNSIGSTMDFTGVTQTDSAVVIESGAQISALQQNSYLAVVAPRVVQGGVVDVDGSVAYVAAEQAQLTINNGLFDIAVGVGSADANGVVHTGTTTGAAAIATADGSGVITDAAAQGIYMVAVPKNTAISMLVGGNVGYEPAMSAALADNGSIILSAGAGTVTGGTIALPTGQVDFDNAVAGGSVMLNEATFASTAEVFASDTVTLSVSGTDTISSGSDSRGAHDLIVAAGNGIAVSLQDSGTIDIDGHLSLKSGGPIDVDLTAAAGNFSVGESLLIDTSAFGAADIGITRNNGGTGIGADATAGAITLALDGGTNFTVADNLLMNALAQGGLGENQNGSSNAGDITVSFNSTGTTSVGGSLVLNSQALSAQDGKDVSGGIGFVGNDSTAGNVTLNLGGTSSTIGGLFLDASANGSAGSDGTVAQSNDATAGAISVNIAGGNHQFGDITMFNQANGAESFDETGASIAGFAERGIIDVNLTNSGSILGVATDFLIDATTDGEIARPDSETVSITVDGTGPSGGISIGGQLAINTIAGGGASAGTTIAGSVLIDVTDGGLNSGVLNIDTSASPTGRDFSGGDGSGQNFQGGDVTIRANTGGSISAGSAFIFAEATGAQSTGGDATGGAITIDANNGAIAFLTDITLLASAGGGASIDPADGSAGVAVGGDVTMAVSGASGVLDLADAFITTDASIGSSGEGGSEPFSGQGGSSVAGSVNFAIDGGNLTAGSVSISSLGLGGSGGTLPPTIAARSTGLPSAGDGGSGQGGIVTFELAGGNAVVADLAVTADGVGGNGADGDFDVGTRGGAGGESIGGTVVFDALSGSLTTNSLTISARANPDGFGGAGGFGEGSEGGDGGDATGGSATFNLTGTAVISADAVQVSTDGLGGAGGSSGVLFGAGPPVDGADAGNGGSGTGGTSVFNHTSGTISFTDLTSSARGIGGSGGDSFGFSFGDSTGAGGAGGDGIGGSAAINLNQDDGSNPVYSVNADASGGAGGAGLSSGAGGAATGGIATLAINNSAIALNNAAISANGAGGNAGFSDTAGGTSGAGGSAIGGTASLEITGAGSSLISASPLQIQATAIGGSGADGAFGGGAGINGDNGGVGGSAAGGTARIELTGAGTALTVSSSLTDLSSDASGGRGGAGGSSSDAVGGTGGLGGDATGGSLTLQANSGTTLTINEGSGPFSLSSTGTGGDGGIGGDGFSTGSAAGIGGDGGTGEGGSPTLRAIGGTITGTDVTLSGFGVGGNGSAGGTGPFSALTPTGNGGDAQGGNPIMQLLDGSPGIISLGDVNIVSSGTAGTGTLAGSTIGGRVDVSDLSPTVGGVFSFNSLTVTVLGDIASIGGGFFFDGSSGTNTITAQQIIDVVGDISYMFDGNGQLVVGDATELTATGDILVTHTNNTGLITSFANGGDFDAVAGQNFIADEQSIISSDADILIRADGNAEANDLRAFSNIDFSAGQDATVGNASVIGPRQTSPVGAGFFVTNGISIRAGGDDAPMFELYDGIHDATIIGDVRSTGFVSVIAGGNAVFAPGSNTISDNGVTVRTGDDIIIASGALVEAGANLTNPIDILLPFADFNNLVLDAGALARSGELVGNPPTPLASIVSAGNMAANNFAVILNANAIDGLGGTISAGSIQADIVDAPNAGLPQGDDAGLLSAQCLAGNICLGSISADNRLEVGQNSNNDVIQLIVDQGAITANDVLITIREDIAFGSIAAPTTLNAANTFAIESLTGDVSLIDTAINSDQITIVAAGGLLGNGALTSSSDIGITVGQDVNALLIDTGGQLTDALNVGGAFETEYTVAGAIDVTTYTQGANTPVRIVAAGDNSFGAINVPLTEDITLIAGDNGLGTGIGDVFLGAATGASTIALTGDNVGFGDLTAEQSVVFTAGAGSVTGGSLTADGALDVSGDTVTVGALTAGDVLTVDAAAGNIVTGAIDGSDAASLTATGDITTGAIAAGGTGLSMDAGGDIAFTSATSSADITMVSAGTLIGGDLNADGALSLDGSDIAIGDASAATIALVSGLNILFDSLTSPNAINLSALTGTIGANTVAGDIDSDGDVDLAAQAVDLGNITSGGSVTANATAGDASFGTIDAANDITISASGTPSVTNAISGGNTSISGSAVTFANGTVGGDLSLTAIAGDIDGNGTVSVAGGIALDAPGDIAFGSLSAQGGDFTADAGGAITFIAAGASDALDFAAGGAIAATAAISAGEVALDSGDTISAASITATDALGTGIEISGTNGITVGSLTGNTALLEADLGPITVSDDIDVSGLLEAEGQSVFLRSTNALAVRADAIAGDIDIVTTGDLDLSGLTASGDIDLTSAGVQSSAPITSSGGDVNITATNDFSVSSDVSAANVLTLAVGGLLDLNAGASGTTIDAQLGDINISTVGSLGRSDVTTAIAIATAGDIALGGAGGGSPSSGLLELSNDEVSRIFSGGDLSIIAEIDQQGAGGNMTVDALDVSAAEGTGTLQDGNIGQGGALFLEAAGSIDVIGVATMTNAGVDTGFALDAAEAIRVDPASGALLVQDANGELAGALGLTASRIEAISELARMDIAGAATTADIDSRLGENDGDINDTGYFAAADLSFTADDAVLIQNSGDGTEFDDRRGFTADTVTINSPGSGTVIVVNGIVNSLTGVDAIAALGLPASFDPGSTVNGCLILDIVSCSSIPESIGNPGLRDPIQDLIDREIVPSDSENPATDAEAEDDEIFAGIVRDMRKTALLREDPLLDEPVTGAGNEDLWVTDVDCEGADAGSAICGSGGALEPAE